MSQEQFNRLYSHTETHTSRNTIYTQSRSEHTEYKFIAIFKWSTRVKKQFPFKRINTMTNGGGERRWQSNGEAIVISRHDVETVYQYASTECDLRDHTMIRLPIHSGLRNTEIRTLRREWINFETGIFQVLDSKKHRFYPVPLDILTLQLLEQLTHGLEGLVFRHKSHKHYEGKPLTKTAVWKQFKIIGEAAGVKGFTPRLCRHYFAANSMYPRPDENGEVKAPMKIETLRRILRHANLTVTHKYLARLVFIEDIKRDYDRLQNPYVAQVGDIPRQSQFYEEFCSKCEFEPVCKFKQRMCSCQATSGCRFYKPKKKEVTIKHE